MADTNQPGVQPGVQPEVKQEVPVISTEKTGVLATISEKMDAVGGKVFGAIFGKTAEKFNNALGRIAHGGNGPTKPKE